MVKLFGSLFVLWIIILAVVLESRDADPGKRSQSPTLKSGAVQGIALRVAARKQDVISGHLSLHRIP